MNSAIFAPSGLFLNFEFCYLVFLSNNQAPISSSPAPVPLTRSSLFGLGFAVAFPVHMKSFSPGFSPSLWIRD